MPRGVYERRPRADSPPRKGRARLNGGDGFAKLLQAMRAEKTRAEDRVVALGTAIEAIEAIEDR